MDVYDDESEGEYSPFEYEDDSSSSDTEEIPDAPTPQKTVFPDDVKQNLNKNLYRKRRDPVDNSGSSPNAHVPQPENRVPRGAVQNKIDINGAKRRSARLQRKKGNIPADERSPSPTQQQAVDIRSNVEGNHFENSGTLHVLQKWVDVLEEIFKHRSVKDLKNCRHVCRLWRDVSFLTWRSYGYVTINPDVTGRKPSDFEMFSSNYHPHLASLEGQIRELPFTNYKLLKKDFHSLYQNWGLHISRLTLDDVKFNSQNAFLDTIFKFCQNLANLALIKVQVTQATEEIEANSKKEIINWSRIQIHNKLKFICLDFFKWEGATWMEFLHRIPSIQSLSLRRSVSNSKELFESLGAIRKRNPNNLNLKTVHFFGQKISSDNLSILLDPKLDLESFELSHVNVHDLNTLLPNIIANNTHSLQKLVIYSVGSDTTDINNFQLSSENQLENLQELNITLNGMIYTLAGFLKVAPNLRKLIFGGTLASQLGIGDVSNAADIKLNYCSEMEMDFLSLSNQDLEHLINWTPNLKILKITGLNNELFSMVCGGWSNLVRLDALKCSVDDSGITGLDAEDMKKINKHGKKGGWRPITVPRANITSLKGLRKLNLHASSFQYLHNVTHKAQSLSYCAVACGIDLLSNLTHLKIDNFKLNRRQMTLAAWQYLFTRLNWPEDEK